MEHRGEGFEGALLVAEASMNECAIVLASGSP